MSFVSREKVGFSISSVKKLPAVATETSHAMGEAVPLHLIGKDPRIQEVLDLVAQVADTDATILITGESGTGKEIIAQTLHEQSSRVTPLSLRLIAGL